MPFTRSLAVAAALAAVVLALLGALALRGGGGEGTVRLIGSGSTFLAPQMYAWAEQIRERYPWIVVEYESVGSGAGLANFLERVRDFGASDPPVPRDVWERHRGRMIQMPVVLGAVAIVYNIPGLEGELKLTGEVVAKIYKGEVRYWDDPEIRSLNPGLQLPHEEIVAVHRSDSSGTTHVFTLFLHKAAPNVWPKELVGKAIDWPVDYKGRGVGAKGNEGVTKTVKNTPYSIGYVELSYAIDAGLAVAAVANARGEFIVPSVESIQRAASAATLPESPLGDFTEAWESVVYAEAPGAYPIASFSFLLFYTEYPVEKLEAVKKLIEYVNTEGQMPGNIVEGYIPIPESIRQFNLQALNLVKPSEG